MSEIHYKSLDTHIHKLTTERGGDGTNNRVTPAPVYLIFGEEFLCKAVFEQLLKAISPVGSGNQNLERIDGPDEDIHEVIERVNTYSLLPGTKIVAVTDSGVFDSKEDKEHLLDKAKKAYQNDNVKKAAKYLISMMGRLKMSFQDFSKENRPKTLKYNSSKFDDDQWLDDILDYCIQNNLAISAAEEQGGALQSAIEKGFPRQNHLIIITDTVNKRHSLYKSISSHGIIIDCSIPKGNRRSDKLAQQKALSESLDAILLKNQKSIESDAHRLLYEMTGFDLRTFSNNIDKLVSYVGERKIITRSDVAFVLKRTKKDPIYAFTNAITEKNAEEALFYLESLLFDGLNSIRPEQILVAMANQIRKLILIKGFVAGPQGDSWYKNCTFGDFKKSVLPVIQKHDKKLLDQLRVWQDMLSTDTVDGGGEGTKKVKKKSGKSVTELLIAKTPTNSYPVYQMFKKSEIFTQEQLFNALESLNRADLRIKTSVQNKKLILEEAIINICR